MSETRLHRVHPAREVRPGRTASVRVDGRHLRVGSDPFRIRGVSYGSFAARADGARFPEPGVLCRDLEAIAAAGFNTVRVYSTPPHDLLDAAAELGLRVLVGVHYEDWRYESTGGRQATRRVRDRAFAAIDEAVAVASGRPEVLAVSVGNEIPVDVVRLHGIGRVQDSLEAIVDRVHRASDDLLVTYGNFPTTEFLTIENLDLISFNVFLEDDAALRRYLLHLQAIAGNKPLLLSEVGLAAAVHGDDAQADLLDRQLTIADEVGCAGATVFSWTDDWVVDGHPVTGWDFGITTTDRQPKPALDVVADWARRDLVDLRDEWPTVSVVVCAYNEEETIAECLDSLLFSPYPSLDVIVCDDGSSDATLELAQRYPFRVLALDHGGLSNARNAGMAAAEGEIIAYLDADAACHPYWPFHLALSLEDASIAATGGPNLPVEGVGLVERAVDRSPGAPLEVLTSHDRAEHVPGCNMAFRRRHLEAIGGFNPVYTSAGDDVDVCWKLLDRDLHIGFAPAAQVSHHRRKTVRGYLRQQRGYGRSERLLWSRHRSRFNRLGQARWAGTIYGTGRVLPRLLRPVVYHGHVGTAPYQSTARRRAELAAMWGGVIVPFLAVLTVASAATASAAAMRILDTPGVFAATSLVISLMALLAVATYGAAVGAGLVVPRTETAPWRLRALVGALHVAQPVARTWGRLRAHRARVEEREPPAWYGNREWWLITLDQALATRGCTVRTSRPTDAHDLEVSRGPFVRARVATAVLWDWDPVAQVRLRLRALPVMLAVSGIGIAALGHGLAGAMVAGMAVVGAGLDAWAVRRRIDDAVAFTTRRHSRTESDVIIDLTVS